MQRSAASEHVYVVIVNYRKWEDTRDCLDFLFRSDYRRFTAIVVDNASGNQSLQRIMEWAVDKDDTVFARLPFTPKRLEKPIPCRLYQRIEWETTTIDRSLLPPLVLLQSDENGGFAAGNNLALRSVLSDDAWVLLLNPDVIVQPDTLTELVRFAAAQPFRTVSGTITKYYEPPHGVHIYGGARISRRSGTVVCLKKPVELPRLDYIAGGALFTHTAHLREIGLLSEEYFLYWEETDWCFRARERGYLMKVCESAVCFDKIGTSVGRGFLAEYYYTRNGLLFLSRLDKGGRSIRLGFTFLRFVKRILTGEWDKARGVYKGLRDYLTMRNLPLPQDTQKK